MPAGDAEAFAALAPLVQAGGVVAFACAVWWEQRQIRRAIDGLRELVLGAPRRRRRRKKAPS